MTFCKKSYNLLRAIRSVTGHGIGVPLFIVCLGLIFKKCIEGGLNLSRLKIRQYLQNSVSTAITVSLLLLMQSSCGQTESNLTPLVDRCPLGEAVQSEDGIRRLALIVGVGQYKSPSIPDLPGPPKDAMRIYELLTGSQGYGFPKENVCVLLDAEASTANFKKYFSKVLINRAHSKDEAVIYYAGHGSQTRDKNSDEQDGMDETFVFHDARSDGIKDFADDEFDRLLTKLYEKTQRITVFLDSCNSGSAIRGDVEFLSRYVPPESESSEERGSIVNSAAKSEKAGWVSSSLPGIVVFTAAGDGTSALEKNARGIFTDAVLTTLGSINARQLTYAQAARQIRPLVKAESYQIPYFQGDIQRSVFSGSNRNHPLSWEIIEVEPQLKLGGFPLPGIEKGAEFRVYDGSIDGAQTQDPGKAKAVIVTDVSTGLNAIAHITSRPANAETIRAGDLAVLSRPGDEQRMLKVTLRAESRAGGITAEKAGMIAANLEKHPDAKTMITLVQDKGGFELSQDSGEYVVKGPENLVRNRFKIEKDVIENLRQHALQRVLSTLRGEGGNQFVDQETLQVQIVPAQKQDQCTHGHKWRQELPNAVVAQKIPLCYKWNVKVKVSEESPVRLLIGGLILSTDGSIFGFPADGSVAPLSPGEEIVFAAKGETFVASYPLNIEDQIIVFGTQENNPVPWSRLTQSSMSRAGEVKNGLYRALDRYLSGTRGVARPVETIDQDTAWTLSSITMRVTDDKP